MRDPGGSLGKEDSPLRWLTAILDCSLLMPLGNVKVYSHLPVRGKTEIEGLWHSPGGGVCTSQSGEIFLESQFALGFIRLYLNVLESAETQVLQLM